MARDKHSQRRTTRLLRRPIGLAPDIGQLLEPLPLGEIDERVIDQVQSWRGQGLKIVTIVPNAHFGVLYGNSRRFVDEFSDVLSAFLAEGFACIVLAHETRRLPGDPKLVAEIVRRQRPGSKVLPWFPNSAAEAKAVISLGDICFTARLHAGVAALSLGIPAVGVDYVDKFHGQFEWFGQEARVLSREALSDPQVVLRASLAAASSSKPRRVELTTFAENGWFIEAV